jgi:hypothetical protein
MVKISIKKEEKTIKPRQKQKQKQSQKVVVNIGSNVVKPKRRRAPRQALQKSNVVNRQQTTPTQINVPQALPIQQQPKIEPMNELIKYLRESEKNKDIIKEQDKKINELEKDKKDKDKSKILTPDEVQDSFSKVYNDSNISSLTNSGISTPFFSRPVDPQELYDLLRKEADLRGGNPNSGNISFATLQSTAPSSNSTLTTQSSDGIDQRFVSTRETGPIANTTRDTIARMWLGKARQSIADRLANTQQDLSTYMTQAPPKEPTETKMQSKYDELLEDEIEMQQVVSPEVVPADEDPVIDEILKEEPENQITIYEPQRATAQTATATQQLIGIDNSSLPAFLRPINTPLPAIHFKDIIGQKPTAAETKDIRQARINKLDKKPLLAIESQSTQEETKDTIKPKTPTKPPPAAAAEPESQVVGTSIQGFDDFTAHINDAKNVKNKDLGQILIKNKIKDPTTGNNFYIDGHNRVLVRGHSNALNRTQLTELLKKEYKPGLNY